MTNPPGSAASLPRPVPPPRPGAVRLVCDSTADLAPEFRARHGIEVVPLKVIFGNEELDDGSEIDAASFYARMRAGGPPPRTSQPSPAAFEAAFRRAASGGGPVLCTTLSARLSGTHEAARAAAVASGVDVLVVDSGTAGLGHHQVVRAAARAIAAGQGRDEVGAVVSAVSAAQRLVFTVSSLEYLRRGGRIGGAQALLGSLLSIKPILELRDGRIEALDRVRTDRRALARLLSEAEAAGAAAPLRVTIAHAERPHDAAALAEALRARSVDDPEIIDVGDPEIIDVGPVIGCHGGPGSLGVVVHPAAIG